MMVRFSPQTPEDVQCDFCDSQEPEWDIPARTFRVKVPVKDRDGNDAFLDYGSHGNWAACDPCKQLIEEGKWEELAQRSLDTHPLRSLMDEETLVWEHRNITTLHWALRPRITGPPMPIDREDMASRCNIEFRSNVLCRLNRGHSGPHEPYS